MTASRNRKLPVFLELRVGVGRPEMRLQDKQEPVLEGLLTHVKDFGPHPKGRQNRCWST